MPYPSLGPASEPRSAMPGPIRQEPDRDDDDDADPAVDLDAIRARCDAATPGPWAIPQWNENAVMPIAWANEEGATSGRGPFAVIYASGSRANAEFIAHARTDIPNLLATIQRLEQEKALLPGEHMVLTVAQNMIKRGENPQINVTTALVMMIERLADLGGGTGPHNPGDTDDR